MSTLYRISSLHFFARRTWRSLFMELPIKTNRQGNARHER